MKKPSGWSWHVYWERERKHRRRCYLYVFPAHRLGGWLCDGNDTRGMAMLERQKDYFGSPASLEIARKQPASATYIRKHGQP